jgi:hypothetical protein
MEPSVEAHSSFGSQDPAFHCGKEEEKHDKIRLILEIGSLQKTEATLQNAKNKIQKQLYDYMVFLGDEGERWATNVLGVAILGTEVCFSHPRRSKHNGWVTFTNASKWYNSYNGTFIKEIDKVAEMCRQDEDQRVGRTNVFVHGMACCNWQIEPH